MSNSTEGHEAPIRPERVAANHLDVRLLDASGNEIADLTCRMADPIAAIAAAESHALAEHEAGTCGRVWSCSHCERGAL